MICPSLDYCFWVTGRRIANNEALIEVYIRAATMRLTVERGDGVLLNAAATTYFEAEEVAVFVGILR